MNHKVSHFKDFIPKAFLKGDDMILDAEVLMVDNKTGKPLPFGTLGVHKAAGSFLVYHPLNDCLQKHVLQILNNAFKVFNLIPKLGVILLSMLNQFLGKNKFLKTQF